MAIFETGRFKGDGWAVGHMAHGALRTESIGVKWEQQPKGPSGIEWRTCRTAMTLSVLVNGRFRMDFREKQGAAVETVVLESPGSYVIFGPGIEHRSEALEETLFLTIRWPSIEGDCRIVERQE